MDEDDCHSIMVVIFERISIVDVRQTRQYRDVGLKIMKDIDIADALVMAAALSLNCPMTKASFKW